MAEQDQTPQGAIPPKVTPFIKPNPEKPAVTPAATPAITPAGAPRPITVRLKPVVVPGSPQAAVPAAGVPAPSPTPANLRATSRVLITEAMLPDDAATPSNKDEEAPTSATTATGRPLATAASATVRLRPVTPPSLQPPTAADSGVGPPAERPQAAVLSAGAGLQIKNFAYFLGFRHRGCADDPHGGWQDRAENHSVETARGSCAACGLRTEEFYHADPSDVPHP